MHGRIPCVGTYLIQSYHSDNGNITFSVTPWSLFFQRTKNQNPVHMETLTRPISSRDGAWMCLVRKRGQSQRLLLGDWMPLTHCHSEKNPSGPPFPYIRVRHVMNASVRETTGCPPVSTIIKTRRLRFFGHVARSDCIAPTTMIERLID